MPSVATIQIGYPVNGLDVKRALTFTCESLQTITPTLAGAVEDMEVAVPIDVSGLQFMIIYSSKELIIKVNDVDSPADEFTVQAGVPFVYYRGGKGDGDDDTPRFEVDTTAFFISKEDSGTEVPEIIIGQDATP